MIEGLWSLEFISNVGGIGAGVVVFETQRIFGGDSQYYYVGQYEMQHDGKLKAEVMVEHYAGNRLSIFGPGQDKFSLAVRADSVQRPTFQATGSMIGSPDAKIAMRLTIRSELP